MVVLCSRNEFIVRLTSSFMRQYLDLVNRVLNEGVLSPNRTGTDAIKIAGAMFEHDMSKGFPLLTTKQMATKLIRVELEGFINGITDKRWYQERGCTVWDEWCNPQLIPPELKAPEKKLEREAFQKAQNDLGPIYGFQWRHWNAPYVGPKTSACDATYSGKGIDQLVNVIETLKKNPNDRRMLVMAWNPEALPMAALPACHYGFQVTHINGELNLLWNQRSVDLMLGLPFNIASYGLLLHLLARGAGMKEGKLIGFLGDVHIYINHRDGAREQVTREPFSLPKLETSSESIYSWTHKDTKVIGYKHHDKISFDIAI